MLLTFHTSLVTRHAFDLVVCTHESFVLYINVFVAPIHCKFCVHYISKVSDASYYHTVPMWEFLVDYMNKQRFLLLGKALIVTCLLLLGYISTAVYDKVCVNLSCAILCLWMYRSLQNILHMRVTDK